MRRFIRFPLAIKLWLVFFLATTLLVTVVLAWLNHSLEKGFKNYLNRRHQAQVVALQPELIRIYQEQGNWQRLVNSPWRWQRLNRQTRLNSLDDDSEQGDFEPLQRERGQYSAGQHQTTPKFKTRFSRGHLFLADANRKLLIGPAITEDMESYWQPLNLDGQIIGFVGFTLPNELKNRRESRFLKQQRRGFAFIGLLSLVVSAVFAFPLAAWLARPIKQLEKSTQALTRGEFDTRIMRIGNDEVGSLARHFNELAATLEANEQSRRSWVADISHELRTPVTFIKGQIEALIDGIRPVNTETLAALAAQINHLSQLINDLYELSQSELGGLNYQKHPEQPATLINQACNLAAPAFTAKGLTFSANNQLPEQTTLPLDQSRFAQLLNNLLANSLRHTHSPGSVKLTASLRDNHLLIILEDSAPGVGDHDLPKLFDRLYRADHSRNSQTGGSGIGLTLCKNIVEAHGGKISAGHSSLGGLQITVVLPGAY